METFPLFAAGKLNLVALQQKMFSSGKKKIVLLNFPNNPTGYTPTEKETNKIVKIIKKEAEKGSKIITIIDDAYFGLVYEKGVFKESIFSDFAGLHENVLAVKIDGASKEL